ncbi:MAG TPA: hypothetical protein VFZ77_09675, partial [Acidimicrobiales bacterium]
DARDLVDRLVRQAVDQGATVLLSSHDLDRAEALADRVVHMVAGTTTAPAAAAPPTEPAAAEPTTAEPTAAEPAAAEPTAAAPPTRTQAVTHVA